MDFSEIAERISQKFVSKGHPVDQNRIAEKLRRLIAEFGVPPDEAERSVTSELAKEFGIAGSGPGSVEQKKLADAQPGDWVTVEVKVVTLTRSQSPAIAQTGIVADATGGMRFVVWVKAHAPVLTSGKWYRIESAVVDEFRGVPSLKVHSGTTITELAEDGTLIPIVTPVKDLIPGVGNVRVKVIQEWETTHDRMLQSGLLADETGTVKFVIWQEEGKEKLTSGKVYSIFHALVDEFNGRLSLNLNTAEIIAEEGDIAVSSGETEAKGALVHIAPGSGLVKRCPVPGCNRVLSRQNYCPVHEMQPNFNYDLRIKGWLDNGEKTWEVLVPREAAESLTGMTLDQARELAENNPLGMDEIFLRMRDRVLGRYFSCKGREIERRIIASSCAFLTFDPAVLATLLNRAGGESS